MKKIICFFSFILSFVCIFALNAQKDVQKDERQEFTDYGKKFLGFSYKRGGTGVGGFDCSGLVFCCAKDSLGKNLPRTAKAIAEYAKPISLEECKKGDLLFFSTTSSGQISHVGIYLENGNFLHSASDGPQTGVIISSLGQSYWKNHYTKAGRIIFDDETCATDSPIVASNAELQASKENATKPKSPSSQSSQPKEEERQEKTPYGTFGTQPLPHKSMGKNR